jgi:glycerol-3-phosphate acyltransferase PlsY
MFMTTLQYIALWYIAAGLAAYLIGAIPFGLLIARLRGVDIRRVGSGNIGATNVFRSIGKGWGILTFCCDALKGFLPAYSFPALAARLGPENISIAGLAMVCAALAVVGHNWPVYLRFKGGKGVATSAGALLALAPAAIGVGLLTWLLVFGVTRYVSVASIAAAGAVAGAGWFLAAWQIALLLTVLSAVIIWRHKANIQRLRAGTELRFQFRKSK